VNEDWDEMTAEPLAGEELERMLARYARVRLDPGQAQVRRARAAVMEQAWRQRIEAIAPAAPARRVPFSRWNPRRMGLSLAVAVMAGLMLGSSVFAASRAGGPLYETRLSLETLTLPADPAARVDARLTAAQARLGEAVEAAGRHDQSATHAALEAYDRTIDELLSAEGPEAARALAAIQFHHTILLEIADSVPDAAAAGISKAITSSEKVIDRLTATGDPGNGGNPGSGSGPGGGNPGGNPGANPGGRSTPEPGATEDATDRPGRTKDPDATPRPTKTDKPVATPEPQSTATPRPQKTPVPHPTPNPGGPGPSKGSH
jgi:hypothetical protein